MPARLVRRHERARSAATTSWLADRGPWRVPSQRCRRLRQKIHRYSADVCRQLHAFPCEAGGALAAKLCKKYPVFEDAVVSCHLSVIAAVPQAIVRTPHETAASTSSATAAILSNVTSPDLKMSVQSNGRNRFLDKAPAMISATETLSVELPIETVLIESPPPDTNSDEMSKRRVVTGAEEHSAPSDHWHRCRSTCAVCYRPRETGVVSKMSRRLR